MTDTYLTIASMSEGIYREKGSKFLAFAYPVQSIETIKEHIETLKKQYHDARHHCYAYRLGVVDEEYRQNDDGEPSGTAGKPIYGQILSAGLTDVLLVVVRYFGGTLLGTSGLIRAYKSAAADSIANARIITQYLEKDVLLTYPYDQTNEVMRLMNEYNLKPSMQLFEGKCEMQLKIRLSRLDETIDKFNKLVGVTAIEVNQNHDKSIIR